MTASVHDGRDDWFSAEVGRIASAADQACDAIRACITTLEAGREAHVGGACLVEVVQLLISAGGRETRVNAADAFCDFQRAIGALRSKIVRSLVEDEGLSLTEASRRMDISRQSASRLYEVTALDVEGRAK